MREESQLDQMRDAIRGDFERLAERRGDQQLLRVSESGPIAPEEPEPEPETELSAELARRSWFARLFTT